jgi:hypothetical protein
MKERVQELSERLVPYEEYSDDGDVTCTTGPHFSHPYYRLVFSGTQGMTMCKDKFSIVCQPPWGRVRPVLGTTGMATLPYGSRIALVTIFQLFCFLFK